MSLFHAGDSTSCFHVASFSSICWNPLMLHQIPDPAPASFPTPPSPKKGMSTGCIVALVLGIIAAFLAVIIFMFAILGGAALKTLNRGKIFEEAAELRIKSDIHSTISIALESYFVAAGRYPTTEQGLAALVEKPTIDPVPERWHAAMDEIPTDAWKRPYKYRCPAERSGHPFDLWSVGKDGIDGTADDMGNW